ncbi:MAG: GNAT family N-acetyltransferase [Candidatus Zixiibacteriota bacterium]
MNPPPSIADSNDRPTIESASTPSELKALADQWDTLAFAMPQESPFIAYSWVDAFARCHLAADQAFLCIVARNGQELVGLIPLICTNKNVPGVRVSSLATPYDPHITSVDFVLDKSNSQETIRKLLAGISESCPRWVALRLQRIPHLSPTLQTVRRGISGHCCLIDDAGAGSYIETEGDIAQYMDSLGNNHRRNLRKANSRLKNQGNISVEFVTGNKVTDEHYEQFLQLELAGWKGRRKTAILANDSLRSSYSSAVDRLKSSGHIEFHFLRCNDRLLAAHLATRIGSTVTVVKIAFDESQSRLSPGALLFERLVQRSFEDPAVRIIDCLTDMAWHRPWKMKRRQYYDLTIIPQRLVPILMEYLPLRAAQFVRSVPWLYRLARRGRTTGAGESA